MCLPVVLACASETRAGTVQPVAASRTGVSFETGGIVLSGTALVNAPGSLIAAMSGKVPNFRVRRHRGDCPDVTLRGHVSLQHTNNPHVYVDGTRSTDTCVLETIRTDDVERIEVYPRGFTTRPGYGTHAAGLILVFMRSS
jgi:hypothetical protein